MDTHVKEGQLYVQHQKFGKVSLRKKSVVFVGVALTEMKKDALLIHDS